MTDDEKLLQDVRDCDCCTGFGFKRPATGGPYLKFPPTIGAAGRAAILFVGINPRISDASEPGVLDNEAMYHRIMADPQEFAALARNRDGKERYIAPGCPEKHYHRHVAIVQKLFGSEAHFEDCAAVTELFFCATRDSEGLPIAESPCAARYFERVFLKVRPLVVCCVWKSVLRYFQRLARAGNQSTFVLTLGGHSALVIEMPR